jgi:hypothetical protein
MVNPRPYKAVAQMKLSSGEELEVTKNCIFKGTYY